MASSRRLQNSVPIKIIISQLAGDPGVIPQANKRSCFGQPAAIAVFFGRREGQGQTQKRARSPFSLLHA